LTCKLKSQDDDGENEKREGGIGAKDRRKEEEF
jgi:hypothetical protein